MQPALRAVLLANGKKAPDVVCTHYDSDHIGGLIPLLADYIADIQQVWVHNAPDSWKAYITRAASMRSNAGQHALSWDNYGLELLLESYPAAKRTQARAKVSILLESLPQLQQLIALIPTHKLVQAFTDPKPLVDWPEVSVLGPTAAYYQTLFPPNKSFESFLQEEALSKLSTDAA